MSIGRAIRTRLGRLETPVSDFYRSRFIDLDACARLLADIVEPSSILEAGCGDGQMASRLLAQFPDAQYQGVDIAPDVGRLFVGDRDRARFRSVDSRSYLEETQKRFDLVLLVDVLHHIPPASRESVLNDVRTLTRPGGHYALKDWVRSRSLIHLAAWASDRLLTGDRIAYFDPGELEAMVPEQFPGDERVALHRVPPRVNNLLAVYRRAQ